MTRRALMAAIAGAALDPDRLLWRPGAKLISIPAPPPPLEIHPYELNTIRTAMLLAGVLRRYEEPCTQEVRALLPVLRRIDADAYDPDAIRTLMTTAPVRPERIAGYRSSRLACEILKIWSGTGVFWPSALFVRRRVGA